MTYVERKPCDPEKLAGEIHKRLFELTSLTKPKIKVDRKNAMVGLTHIQLELDDCHVSIEACVTSAVPKLLPMIMYPKEYFEDYEKAIFDALDDLFQQTHFKIVQPTAEEMAMRWEEVDEQDNRSVDIDNPADIGDLDLSFIVESPQLNNFSSVTEDIMLHELLDNNLFDEIFEIVRPAKEAWENFNEYG